MRHSKVIRRVLCIAIAIIGLASWAIYEGFRAMQIEDTYGDLQSIYWQSKIGDIIVCPQTRRVGQLQKEQFHIHVYTTTRAIRSLYSWAHDDNSNPDSLVVYRKSTNEDIPLQYDSVMKAVDENRLERVMCYINKN